MRATESIHFDWRVPPLTHSRPCRAFRWFPGLCRYEQPCSNTLAHVPWGPVLWRLFLSADLLSCRRVNTQPQEAMPNRFPKWRHQLSLPRASHQNSHLSVSSATLDMVTCQRLMSDLVDNCVRYTYIHRLVRDSHCPFRLTVAGPCPPCHCTPEPGTQQVLKKMGLKA